MTYLGNILEYALVTLEKLSAPANDDEMKAAHQKLLREVREASHFGKSSNSSCAMAVIKGLQFILHQIQVYSCIVPVYFYCLYIHFLLAWAFLIFDSLTLCSMPYARV